MDKPDQLRLLREELKDLDIKILKTWDGLTLDYLMNKKYKLQQQINELGSPIQTRWS